jgi:hypothetical protein
MAKATESFNTLDIEQLNALAVRLRDAADSIRNPAARAKLGKDLSAAADVASEHAQWRFTMKEAIADLRNSVANAHVGKITTEQLFANIMNVAEDLESQTGDA